MKFSVIVVCLNSGEKLNLTLDSILQQQFEDYEIVVKDGCSSDNSIEEMRRNPHIRLYVEKDTGIYDAMNQAVVHAEGDFVLFMNCGDVFPDEQVLAKTAEFIDRKAAEKGTDTVRAVFYGDTYSEKNNVTISSAPQITGFTCYRNIPCHQSCFYATDLCKEKPYDTQYIIRADYDHFLWCYYVAGAEMYHMNLTVASYEGGGFSESAINQKRDKTEHRLITETYMPKGELTKYRAIMLLTLAPLRRFLAENKIFSGFYHTIKVILYKKHSS